MTSGNVAQKWKIRANGSTYYRKVAHIKIDNIELRRRTDVLLCTSCRGFLYHATSDIKKISLKSKYVVNGSSSVRKMERKYNVEPESDIQKHAPPHAFEVFNLSYNALTFMKQDNSS